MSDLEREPEGRLERGWLWFLANAPQAAVMRAATAAGRTRALAREPGWHFDMGADDPSALVRFRRDVWEYYRRRGIERPVVLRWYDDLRVRAFLGNDMSLCLYVGGSFEPNEFVFLADVLQPGMTFIDGGANDGLYSLFAKKRVGSDGVVLAVEPSSREFARLTANVALNGLPVTARQVALGCEPGRATLSIAESGHEGQNTIGTTVSNPKVATASRETVDVTTLDALVEENAVDRVDVVKLDIEGSEVDALLGARTTIERFRPLFLLEAETERLASQGRTKNDLANVVGGYGYELFVFDEASGALRPPRGVDEPEGNAVAAPRGWRPPS